MGQKMKFLREILETLVLAVIIFAVAQATVQSFVVEKHSMDPTLSEGQRLLVNKAVYWRLGGWLGRHLPLKKEGEWAYLFHLPRRGEIVVFRAPHQVDQVWIKRIIGLPGEQVEIRDGRVYINGKALYEPYAHGSSPPLSPVVVPAGTYFVMGDNRSQSTDSSDWEGVGPIPLQNIIGKAWLSLWPLGRAPNYSYAGG
jgi:signal peptidase I